MEPNNSPDLETAKDQPNQVYSSRRKFLQFAGATGVLASVTASCRKGGFPGPPIGKQPPGGKAINLGSGDTGILNYAYALEQLEAAFYTIVVAVPYRGISAFELSRLKDIRDHEIAHREFLKTALGSSAIPALTPDFESINFTSRDSVLAASKSFEDLGVSAYNGAGSLISSPDYLTLAGKIVSVEARHAAFIRDLITPGSFADSTVIGTNGLDTSRTPPQVLAIAGAYIIERLDASHLPTS